MTPILFDLAPKSIITELYDFEDELRKLRRGFESGRIILILGMRRTGKSSLLRCFLNESNTPHIMIDTRRIITSEGRINLRDFMMELGRSLSLLLNREAGIRSRTLELFRNMSGIEVNMDRLSINLSWRRGSRVDIALILDKINQVAEENGLRTALAIDKAQELRDLPLNFPAILAYVYNNLKNIVTILTGSQIELLYDLLKIEDPNSPLYGRLLYEIKLRRLSLEEAIGFLNRGFREVRMNVDESLIRKAVETLNGIIGWLTYFGWSLYQGENSIEKFLIRLHYRK
ncbi:MAG: ATP-binding protein [Candidatus Methanomethylicia archaeon]